MRPGNIVVVDLIVQSLLIFAQIRLQMTLWRAVTKAGWTAPRCQTLAMVLVLFNVYLFLGMTAGTSAFPIRLTVAPSWRATLLFPSTLWLFGSMGSYTVFVICRFLARRVMPSGTEASEFSAGRRHALQALGYAAIATPATALVLGATIGRTDYQVREVEIPITGLHPDLDGLRIVQISDIHLGDFLSERELARAIDISNTLRGHLGLITGDLITKFGDPLPAAIRQIARLKTDAGVFGCNGNHEIYAETELLTQQMCARIGVPILRKQNQVLRFGRGQFNLAGVDYQSSIHKRAYLQGTEALIVPGMPNFLMSHNPDVFPVAVGKGFDVTFSGHTHGGQVTIEIIDQAVNFARFYTPFVSGLYRRGDKSVYVTRGIGTIGIPSRVGAFPEITLVRLKRA